MTQESLSPSTSINGMEALSAEEGLYLVSLPDALADQLTSIEMVHLVRTEYANWPEELKAKMEPWLDLENEN